MKTRRNNEKRMYLVYAAVFLSAFALLGEDSFLVVLLAAVLAFSLLFNISFRYLLSVSLAMLCASSVLHIYGSDYAASTMTLSHYALIVSFVLLVKEIKEIDDGEEKRIAS